MRLTRNQLYVLLRTWGSNPYLTANKETPFALKRKADGVCRSLKAMSAEHVAQRSFPYLTANKETPFGAFFLFMRRVRI